MNQPEQRDFAELRAAVRSYAEREGGSARTRRAQETPAGFDRAAWRDCAALGWAGAMVPETHGGSGLGLAEMAAIAHEAGRVLLPEPLLAQAVLAAGVLRRSAHGAPWLARLVRGELIVAVAWQEEPGQFDSGAAATTCSASGSQMCISGRKRFVACGQAADGFVVSARSPQGLALYWVERDRAGLTYRSARRADGSEHGELGLDRVALGADAMIAAPDAAASLLADALDETILAAAAELLGVAERALEITLEYLRTRVQFGKPIGSFQALQHRAVDLFIRNELGAAALEAALAAWSGADRHTRAAFASRVKARCADAALDLCRKAIQMHGAIGFTDECDIGLYLKRALATSAWLGNAQTHRRRYAALVLGDAHRAGERQ